MAVMESCMCTAAAVARKKQTVHTWNVHTWNIHTCNTDNHMCRSLIFGPSKKSLLHPGIPASSPASRANISYTDTVAAGTVHRRVPSTDVVDVPGLLRPLTRHSDCPKLITSPPSTLLPHASLLEHYVSED